MEGEIKGNANNHLKWRKVESTAPSSLVVSMSVMIKHSFDIAVAFSVRHRFPFDCFVFVGVFFVSALVKCYSWRATQLGYNECHCTKGVVQNYSEAMQ